MLRRLACVLLTIGAGCSQYILLTINLDLSLWNYSTAVRALLGLLLYAEEPCLGLYTRRPADM
jgi:hypothetical protein